MVTRFIRRYEVEPNGRAEPFLYSYVTAHEKSVVERVETRHKGGIDVGVLWVRDKGDPEELQADEGHTRKVVCVPLFARGRQAPIPDECGAFLGCFQDHDIRWFVFGYVERDKTAEPPKHPPSKDAPVAGTKPQQPQRSGASSPGISRGNPTAPGARKNP